MRRRNFVPSRRSQVFELLALCATAEYVDLIFARGATIRLEVEQILCHAEDFGEPWPTQWRPEHQLQDGTPQ